MPLPLLGIPTLAYYVAFGPHGPRAPTSNPGDGVKIFGYTIALVGAAGVLAYVIREFGTARLLCSSYPLFFDATVYLAQLRLHQRR